MIVRLGVVVCKDQGFWDTMAPQSETMIHEVEVEIPDPPDSWQVDRVMVLEHTQHPQEHCE